MSEEDFLSRWSRRKREAEGAVRSPKSPAEIATSRELDEAPPVPAEKLSGSAKSNQEEEFDLSSLPPIDSITAVTDISVFLRKGVPLELTRAALRRAWATDPAIRDFVGLAENAWDFNDPNAMPGFGALDQTPEQIRRLVAAIMGEVRRKADATESAVAGDSSDQAPRVEAESASAGAPTAPPPQDHIAISEEGNHPSPARHQATAQNRDAAAQNGPLRRTHGGALPR